MRTAQEIREKIDQLMEKINAMPEGADKEAVCNLIDALLWTIGDESGKPI